MVICIQTKPGWKSQEKRIGKMQQTWENITSVINPEQRLRMTWLSLYGFLFSPTKIFANVIYIYPANRYKVR